MTPFLYQVAQRYVESEAENLLDYCFVFPNKRSSTFFSHYLLELLRGRNLITPEITTIAGLTASFSRLVPATRFEQLFTLYDCYRRLSTDIPDFDRFLFWGDMLISDFNDVDRYLVDPKQLFVNVKRLKSLNANFLTEEQLEIIRLYWGVEMDDYDPTVFWSHLSDKSTEVQDKFLKLWEILLPLYENYQSDLRERGLASEGMLLRNTVARLTEMPKESLPFKRYIFVGFNVLSAAEIKIFNLLRMRGAADFYWDFNSPAFDLPLTKGALFMRRNIERFPSLYAVDTEKIKTMPEITITCVPSKIGMVKETGDILKRWVSEGVINPADAASDTAIVLPEEDLFIPMIHSVLEEIIDLNVTMGYPLKYTPMSSLLNFITGMQMRSRSDGQQLVFLLEDVRNILSHPLIRSIENDACDRMMAELRLNRRFLVPADELKRKLPEAFGPFFEYVTNLSDPEEVYSFTRRLVDTLEGRLDTNDKRAMIERYFLRGFADALEELHENVMTWNVTMKESTFFHLLRRSIASASVNFTGEPLKGLQMMGVLETRALDFENIVILSMNERVFPRKHFTRSFIPDSLRRGFRMSTVEFQESIYSYNFYRLISRARRVELLYDGRTEGTNSGEMSRYLSQLLYLFPDAGVRHIRKFFAAPKVESATISITKTDEVMERLARFTKPDGDDRKFLSASSINTYINCPLSFYLKNVEGLDLDDEITDYMDSGTFGTILHEVMEKIYKDLRGDAQSVRITSEVIDAIKSVHKIEPYITESINDHYNRKGRHCRDELRGEALLLGRIMARFVEILLEREKQFTPFDFIDAEKNIDYRYSVNPHLTVNIRQIIDRIDRVFPDRADGGVVRVVDYKTGSDETSFSEIEELFDSGNQKRRKAILQLMFYCNVLAREWNYTGPVQPVIYLFRTLTTKGITPISYNRSELTDYREVNDEFLERFNRVIEEIFDPEVPFTQALDSHACTFCNFKPVCGRETE